MKEGAEVYLCFHSRVFLQLLETCLEQGKALGRDHAHFTLLAGTKEGINIG